MDKVKLKLNTNGYFETSKTNSNLHQNVPSPSTMTSCKSDRDMLKIDLNDKRENTNREVNHRQRLTTACGKQ